LAASAFGGSAPSGRQEQIKMVAHPRNQTDGKPQQPQSVLGFCFWALRRMATPRSKRPANTFNYPHLVEAGTNTANCCVAGIGRDSLSGTESQTERCPWTGKLTHGLIASLQAATLATSA